VTAVVTQTETEKHANMRKKFKLFNKTACVTSGYRNIWNRELSLFSRHICTKDTFTL